MPTIVYSNAAWFPLVFDRKFCRRFPEPIFIAACDNSSGYSGISAKGKRMIGDKSLSIIFFRKGENAGRVKHDHFRSTILIRYNDWDYEEHDRKWEVIVGMASSKKMNTESLMDMIRAGYPEISDLVMFHPEILSGQYNPGDNDIRWSKSGKTKPR